MHITHSEASNLAYKYDVDTQGLLLVAEYFDNLDQLDWYLRDSDADWKAFGMDKVVSSTLRGSMLIAYALGLRCGVARSHVNFRP